MQRLLGDARHFRRSLGLVDGQAELESGYSVAFVYLRFIFTSFEPKSEELPYFSALLSPVLLPLDHSSQD